MGRTGMAGIYGGAPGRSLHGDRSRGNRQLGKQFRRLPDGGLAPTGRCKHPPSGGAQAAASTGQW
jgi:hypothetical protein